MISKSGIKEREVFAFAVSPVIYNIKSFNPVQTILNVYGLTLLFFRNEQDEQLVYLKEFPENTMYEVRVVFLETLNTDSAKFCRHEYLNQNTKMNITMDFESSTIFVIINGVECLSHKIDRNVFVNERATTTLFGYGSQTAPITWKLNEISIYKRVSLMSLSQANTMSGVRSVYDSIGSFDQNYATNASLSNLLLLDVY